MKKSDEFVNESQECLDKERKKTITKEAKKLNQCEMRQKNQ